MKVVLITMLFLQDVFSAERIIYSFGGGLLISFQEVEGILVNHSCVNKKCEAFNKARMFNSATVDPKHLTGGKNPEAAKCKSILGGAVVIGVDRDKNQQSFCKFSDGSYLVN